MSSRLQVVLWFVLPIFALLGLLTFAGWVSGALAGLLLIVLTGFILLALLLTRQSDERRPSP